MTRFRCALLLIAAAFAPLAAQADDFITATTGQSFDDAAFAVESAIVGRGLVIDMTSHTGEMLERTRSDLGSDVVLFDAADIFLFCSADVSRRVMEADPANIRYCPYSITVYQQPGQPVTIGYTRRSAETMAPVNDLLAGLVAEALAD